MAKKSESVEVAEFPPKPEEKTPASEPAKDIEAMTPTELDALVKSKDDPKKDEAAKTIVSNACRPELLKTFIVTPSGQFAENIGLTSSVVKASDGGDACRAYRHAFDVQTPALDLTVTRPEDFDK